MVEVYWALHLVLLVYAAWGSAGEGGQDGCSKGTSRQRASSLVPGWD